MLHNSLSACFGHNLHNAVNSSIKDDPRVSRATGVCRKIVCTFPMDGTNEEILLSTNWNMDFHNTLLSLTVVRDGDPSRK